MLTRHFIRAGARVPRSLTPFIRSYAATNPQTAAPPPSVEELKTAAAGGGRLAPGEVAEICPPQQGNKPGGRRVHGGPPAPAQGTTAKQGQSESNRDEVERKTRS